MSQSSLYAKEHSFGVSSQGSGCILFFRAGVVAYIMPSDYAVMWTETGGLEGRIGFLCLGQNLILASVLQSNKAILTE